ncbi:hypothetical protein ES708_00718 [subsurface metagenome]
MPLTKTKGNNYDWITHSHAHLGGECPHHCAYCYVDNPRFGRHPKYQGELRLIEHEFGIEYGEGKKIFVENCNDLFADKVPLGFIYRILNHCRKWPKNTYIIQTKNPGRMLEHINIMPPDTLLGVTIETNRDMTDVGDAPPAKDRALAMSQIKGRKFVTIEPILDFDIKELSEMVIAIHPEFVNIGADSKGHGLPEPSIKKVMELGRRLSGTGIVVKEKRNLDRLRCSHTPTNTPSI